MKLFFNDNCLLLFIERFSYYYGSLYFCLYNYHIRLLVLYLQTSATSHYPLSSVLKICDVAPTVHKQFVYLCSMTVSIYPFSSGGCPFLSFFLFFFNLYQTFYLGVQIISVVLPSIDSVITLLQLI